MDSKKAQKLSKATVATVLAASGVIVAMPQPSKAALYSDLNPLADYYQAVIELANRNIATGYSDGTFRPNQAITREDAAKMLALAIDVNIANPKNPGFKDVNVNNPNYRYIAALAEAGIINGFSDKTFKPKEYITRGQMAKIITLGFEFGMSQKLNNSFRDVSATNFAAYYIQTLVDLNITKGTSSVTFDPFKNVTRAQMATFIWRADKADRGTPVYTVGDVSDTQIYINGVAYSIASHLRSILNASNKNVLKGASIEGTFSGKTLTNITKLTLNASGTSTRLLALNGNYTSFAGELVVNGSYIRLKNINFTGRVEIATPPRRSLATLQNVRIATVTNFANFIDWDTPTEPKNEDFLNPSDNETLKDKPTTTSPSKYKDRMANVQKYVDFEGSDVRNLVVTADRTFLKSDSEIDRLTVRGDVTNFEFYGDSTAMYLDNDYNMTLYGVHDIDYAYKNSLKNVKLNSDSTYDYYYVTTKSGFTDLGDFAYINNAILPKGTTVNTIFDDYETDEPQIGWIEDENGTPVSRDPVGDTVIPDLTAPKITQLDVNAGGTIADVTLTADEDGTYYYVIKKASEKAPTISEIKTGGAPIKGSGPVIMDEPVKFHVEGLESKTEYVIYAIVIDGQDNASDKKEKEFKTIDSRPPSLNLEPGERMYGGKRVQFKVTPSEAGTIYYYIRPDTSAAAPTIDDIISSPTGTRKAETSGVITITSYDHGKKSLLEDIQPSTKYQIFAVMVDESGNKMRYVEEITITTEKADTIQPYIENTKLNLIDSVKGIFEFEVKEDLDPTTALDEKNYTLSGTGIINISGQKEINPSKVEFGKDKKTIRLTIPSLTALVKGDTIRVTVSKNVTDLAENEFENEEKYDKTIANSPRNVAYYTHEDPYLPTITIDKVFTENNLNKVDVTASKAGTYYYMILEDDYDFIGKGIDSRDFVDEFDPTIASTNTKFGTAGDKDYTGNLLNQYGSAELGKNTLPLIITPENLDPFKSYSLYMVLKDRAGLISKTIVSTKLVLDTKAPLISNLEAEATEGFNDSVTFNFTADESGRMHIIPVKKYIKNATGDYVLNSTFFNSDGTLMEIPNVYPTTSSDGQRAAFKEMATKVGKSISTQTFEKGEKSATFKGLDAHEEYGFYIAVEDNTKQLGNFTIFSRQGTTNPADPAEPMGNQLIKYAYTDGVKPEIEDVIIRDEYPNGNGDVIFNITFSESILRQPGLLTGTNVVGYNISKFKGNSIPNISDILEITTASGTTDISGSFSFENYSVASSGKATLKIKAAPTVITDQVLKIRMKPNTTTSKVSYDYINTNNKVQNEFDLEDFGYYYSPNVLKKNKITYAGLGTPLAGSGTQSKSLIIEINLEATHVGEFSTTTPTPIKKVEQQYYYAILPNDPNISDERLAKEIMNKANGGSTSILMTYADVVPLTTLNDTIGRKELTIPSTNNNVFQAGHRIYLFTLDNYGNIIWAFDGAPADGSVTNNNYRIIQQ